MAVLSERILEAAGKRPEGALLAAKQFLALGNRAAVDQASGAGGGDRPAQPGGCSAGEQRCCCCQRSRSAAGRSLCNCGNHCTRILYLDVSHAMN